ncbi:hypothetical protein BDR22DRAFT_891390 [Usnea florida]
MSIQSPSPAPLLEASTVTPKTVIAVGAILPAVAIIAVALRFYVRIVRTKSMGFDDTLILLALILTLALGIMMVIGSAVHALAQPTPQGNGLEGFLTVLDDAIITTEKMKYAFDLLQVIILGTIKLSVIYFYRRIFRGKTFDYYSKGMIAVVGFWTTAFFLSFLFECGTHFEDLWSTLLNLVSHCAKEEKFFKAFAVSDVIIDGLILAMPSPIIWRLHMSFDNKLALCAVFLLGAVAVAAALARVVIFQSQLADGWSISQGILVITTWMYWSMIELSLSITAACLPTLRPLLPGSSVQGWYEGLQSYLKLLSRSSSTRSNKLSNFDTGPSTNSNKDSERHSNSSQMGILAPNVAQMTTNIYPLHDVEAQKVTPGAGITVRSKIEQASSER